MNRNFLTLTFCFLLGITLASQIQANENDSLTGAFGNSNTSGSNQSNTFTRDDLAKFVETLPGDVANEDGVYSFKYETKELTLPARLGYFEESREIWAVYSLDSIPESMSIADCGQHVLALLENNGTTGDYFFKFNKNTRMIQLWGCCQIRGQLSQADIKTKMDDMAAFARQTYDLWNTSGWGKNDAMYVGTWSCAASNMKLQLTTSETFQLNANGQNMSGQFKIDGDKLDMQDQSGDRIQGDIRFDNANQFTLMVNGSKMVFVRQ